MQNSSHHNNFYEEVSLGSRIPRFLHYFKTFFHGMKSMGFSKFSIEDTAQKCDMPTLLNYLVGTTAFEWKSLCDGSDVATEISLEFADYSPPSKRLGELNYWIVERIYQLNNRSLSFA